MNIFSKKILSHLGATLTAIFIAHSTAGAEDAKRDAGVVLKQQAPALAGITKDLSAKLEAGIEKPDETQNWGLNDKAYEEIATAINGMYDYLNYHTALGQNKRFEPHEFQNPSFFLDALIRHVESGQYSLGPNENGQPRTLTKDQETTLIEAIRVTKKAGVPSELNDDSTPEQIFMAKLSLLTTAQKLYHRLGAGNAISGKNIQGLSAKDQIRLIGSFASVISALEETGIFLKDAHEGHTFRYLVDDVFRTRAGQTEEQRANDVYELGKHAGVVGLATMWISNGEIPLFSQDTLPKPTVAGWHVEVKPTSSGWVTTVRPREPASP